MSILSGFKKQKIRQKLADGNYKDVSSWTSSQTVEMDNGNTLETEIENIIDGTTKVAKASNADTATKASQDVDGNPIGETYATKESISNVDNTADANKPVSTAQRTAIDEAYKNSNTYTDEKIADLINGAPTTLDTLKEIADAMAENEDVVKALETAVGNKANQSELDTHTGNTTVHITSTERTNWGKAYTHSTATHARTDATKTAKSSTNGNILINGTETVVYTHPNSGVTAGTYRSVTVNAAGHITAGSNPTLAVSEGGTGKTTANAAANAFINALTTGSAAPQDADYFISQYAGGGTTNTEYIRRPVSTLWTYIKGKSDSTYAAKSHTHNYAGASSPGGNATNANNAYKLSCTPSARPSSANLTADGSGSMITFKASSNMTKGAPSKGDGHILHFYWDNTSGWDNQLAVAHDGGVEYRCMNNGTWKDWVTLLDSNMVQTATAKTHTNHPSNQDYIPSMAFISHWNGAYNSSNNSNLAYCNKGAFGTMATQNASDYQKVQLASFSGNGNSKEYCLVCTLKIASTYINHPMEITLRERGRNTIVRLEILFDSTDTADPTLKSFYVNGRSNDYYIYKSATSTWQVYAKKNEPYSAITVHGYIGYTGVSVTWNMTNADLPSGATKASLMFATTNTTYSAATTSAAGLMSAADKKKLDGIATGANAYSHPTTSGNKHIPSGGSSGQILRWSADGTAVWGNDNNTTYSAGTGLSLSSTTFSLSSSGATAGTYGNATATATHGGTFTIPRVTVDTYGRVTSIANSTITLPSDNNTDTKVTQTVTTTNASYPLLLAPKGQTATATTTSYFDSGVTLNPSTNTITANISGTATQATKDGSGNVITDTYIKKSWSLIADSSTSTSILMAASADEVTYSELLIIWHTSPGARVFGGIYPLAYGSTLYSSVVLSSTNVYTPSINVSGNKIFVSYDDIVSSVTIYAR